MPTWWLLSVGDAYREPLEHFFVSTHRAEIHRLIFLGRTWGRGPQRFTDEQAISFTRSFIAQGGVVTWDAPIQPNGLISKPFLDQLTAIGKAVKNSTQYPVPSTQPNQE